MRGQLHARAAFPSTTADGPATDGPTRPQLTSRPMTSLFDPLQLGDIALANRIVMAPLTRDRAGAGRTPHALNAEYYAQRADPATGAGLLISEGTQIDALGQGYLDTPGIYSPEQVAGWKLVTDAVHAVGAPDGRLVTR